MSSRFKPRLDYLRVAMLKVCEGKIRKVKEKIKAYEDLVPINYKITPISHWLLLN